MKFVQGQAYSVNRRFWFNCWAINCKHDNNTGCIYLFGNHFLFVQYICVDTMMHVSPGLSRKFRGSTNGSTTGSDSMGIEGAKCGPTISSNSKELTSIWKFKWISKLENSTRTPFETPPIRWGEWSRWFVTQFWFTVAAPRQESLFPANWLDYFDQFDEFALIAIVTYGLGVH